jgi:DNA-binding MarR family transcriptional regulator
MRSGGALAAPNSFVYYTFACYRLARYRFVDERLVDEPTQQRLSSLIWRAARASSRLYRSRLAELDLTNRQAAAILALVEKPAITLGSLADALGADQATTSAVVDRLLGADLVRRETDPADRRRAKLYPTDRALQLAERLESARRATEVLIEEALSAHGTLRLRKLLLQLSNQLERQALTAPIGARTG